MVNYRKALEIKNDIINDLEFDIDTNIDYRRKINHLRHLLFEMEKTCLKMDDLKCQNEYLESKFWQLYDIIHKIILED